MSDLTTQIAVIESQMKQIAKQVDAGFLSNSTEHKELLATFESAIQQKADKSVVEQLQANQNRVVWLVVSSVILALLGLIIKSSIV